MVPASDVVQIDRHSPVPQMTSEALDSSEHRQQLQMVDVKVPLCHRPCAADHVPLAELSSRVAPHPELEASVVIDSCGV